MKQNNKDKSKMKAFHNDIKIQELYLNRIHAHAKADEFIKGSYWEKGKGCAVGCTIHSSNHKAYETELGIPEWLARLEDRIFEGLSNERAKKFPVEFLEAINLGSDLDKIKIPMLIFIVELARECAKNEKSLKAIDGVLFELRKDVLDIPKLREAREAASDAASDAAAYATAYAADDAAAAAADAAADAAAYAAAYAAYAATDAAAYARKKAYENFADKLLQLMRGCK